MRQRFAVSLRDFRVQLAVVVLGGLAVRVWAILAWSRFVNPEGDQQFYLRQSQYLADGLGFVYRRSQTGEIFQTAQHPPLHSILLGLATFLGGDRMQGDSHVYHRLVCAVLGAACVAVVGVVAHRLAGHVAGIVAAVLAAVYPNLWINDAMFVSESTYALMIALVLLAAYEFRDSPTLRRAVVLGAITAFATLARAEAQILFVIMIPPLVYWARRPTGDGDALPEDATTPPRGASAAGRWKLLLAAWAAGGLVLAPWVLRNLTTFEHPALVSSGAGFVVEIANCDQTYGLAPPTDSAGATIDPDASKYLGYWAIDCDRYRDGKPWPEGDETVTELAKRQHGITYIREHLDRFPVVVAARVGRMWDVWRPGQSVDFNTFFERRGHWPTIGGMALYYPMLLASAGALVWLRRRRITIVPFVALTAMVTITAAMSFGITRYRVGVDVALCILTGVFVGAVWNAWRRPGAGPPRASATGTGDAGDATAVPAGAPG